MAFITAADGTRIAYETTGSGRDGATPVVLVHGITERAETWAPLIDPLAATRPVVTLDLRGHGESGTAPRYDLEAMAGDVIAVANALGLGRPHLVGHSLGGAVVSAAGAAMAVSSIVNVDQSLQLDAFKEQLTTFESQLRDPESFPLVVEGLFAMMAGDRLSADEMARLSALRRADQDVVLGVWELILTAPASEIAATVDAALAGYSDSAVPYLSLFGIDPGEGYAEWIAGRIPGAATELWADHGHYPHLVDPDRFVARLEEFWS